MLSLPCLLQPVETMIYFLATVAAIAGFLFGYDEGIIAVAGPLLETEFPMDPAGHLCPRLN